MVATRGKSGRSREAHEETARRPGRRGRSTCVGGRWRGSDPACFASKWKSRGTPTTEAE